MAEEGLLLEVAQPSTSVQGAGRVLVRLDGERVTACEPVAGLMHRGVEKLAEVRDYRQIMALANRHEWLAPFPGELGVALLVEDALGIAVPERATWIRTLLAELDRVLGHLVFLGALPDAVGQRDGTRLAHAARETLLPVVEELTGARMHHMFAVVGGVKTDVPEGWTGRARDALTALRHTLEPLVALCSHRLVKRRLRGLGVVTPEMVPAYGLTGPMARACGIGTDLRLAAPSLAYGAIFDASHVVTREEGDALARLEVLTDQVHVSLDLAGACLDKINALPPGEVNVKLPKVLRVPEGEYHVETENPLGIAGYYVVSRGEKTPYRFAMRTPSSRNMALLPVVAPGTALEDMPALVASMLYVTGDADR